MTNSLREIGTRYTEHWMVYKNEYHPSLGGQLYERMDENHCSRTLEIIAHENGKEICRIIEEIS